jgi:hypothetical protein
LRLPGDRLDPDQISAILRVAPTKAWRRGERYFAGHRTGALVGRTGTWFLATDNLVKSPDLGQRLDFLTSLLSSEPQDQKERLAQLQEVMVRHNLKADVSCFWHAEAGERPPEIPAEKTEKLRAVPAEITGEHLVDELQELGISARELAQTIKVPTTGITGILRGRRGDYRRYCVAARSVFRNESQFLDESAKALQARTRSAISSPIFHAVTLSLPIPGSRPCQISGPAAREGLLGWPV